MTEHQYTAELTFTLPAFTLFSQAGGYVLSAHVLEERVPQKVEDWERAGEIVRVATACATARTCCTCSSSSPATT